MLAAARWQPRAGSRVLARIPLFLCRVCVACVSIGSMACREPCADDQVVPQLVFDQKPFGTEIVFDDRKSDSRSAADVRLLRRPSTLQEADLQEADLQEAVENMMNINLLQTPSAKQGTMRAPRTVFWTRKQCYAVINRLHGRSLVDFDWSSQRVVKKHVLMCQRESPAVSRPVEPLVIQSPVDYDLTDGAFYSFRPRNMVACYAFEDTVELYFPGYERVKVERGNLCIFPALIWFVGLRGRMIVVAW